ncbi:MAG: type I methionyl aminopeptidase [Clostridia bacterium]|nr:type I methionyl aminopeptidase [Clostridia bacterium]
MIQLKNSAQLKDMRDAGRITAQALLVAEEAIREGVSTYEVDAKIRNFIEKCGAKPSFLGLYGFPGSACISINDQVIHGIPSKKVILREGDIVKVDVGAFFHGFHGDSARTFPVGNISDEAKRLIEATKHCFECGFEQVKEGNRVGDIGNAVESCAKSYGYSVVRKYIGHGVGRDVHEAPDVPNFGTAGRGPRLCRGMAIAIEPMINVGTGDVKEMPDGWTVLTLDGKLSAHYENTVALTDEGPIILTDPN